MNIITKLGTLLLLAFTFNIAYADEWIPKTEIKYKKADPELYAKFSSARSTLDSWRGEDEKLESAYEVLTSILSENPNYAPAHREFGRLYIMAIRGGSRLAHKLMNENAERTLLHAISLEPNYAEAYSLLGHTYINLHRSDDAKEALDKAAAIGTQDPWLDMNRADLYNMTRDFEKAFIHAKRVYDRGPSNKKAYITSLDFFRNYWEMYQDADKAEEFYIKEIELEPNQYRVNYIYSKYLLMRKNQPDRAISQGMRTLKLENSPQAQRIIAASYVVKWANALKDNKSKAEAEALLFAGLDVYPYPENIAKFLDGHYLHGEVSQKLLAWLEAYNANN